MKQALVVLSLMLASASALAKPLYITVPRAFGSDEAPVVDLAFAERDPVLLRVLKPTSLDTFVGHQFNLRRAYEQPPVLLNPGRALARGVNAVHNPGRFLLYALSPDFRQDLAPALPKRDGATAQADNLVRVREGATKLVDVPPAMTNVREEWLNLDLGGSDRDFNVPGFSEWNGVSQYQERHVALAPLPAGVYVLQLVQGLVEGQAVLVITDLAVQAKQTDGMVLVRVANREQAPVRDVAVVVHGPSGKTVQGITDQKGEVRLAIDEPRLLITAQHGADVAVLDTDFYSTLASSPDVFIYSDRPVYRPGDVVNFRGILRKPASFLAELFAPKHPMVTVTCEVNDKSIVSHVDVDDFGSFAGAITLPNDAPAGVVHLRADVDGHQHQSEARVQDYVKPTFFVELVTDEGGITPGSNLKIHARARRYAGGVPADAVYDVFLYRTILDTPAWVDDAGLGAQGSVVTYTGSSTQEGTLNIPTRLYSSVVQRQNEPSFSPDDPWMTATHFDAKGEADIVIPVPSLEAGDDVNPFTYTLTVRARDREKTTATASRSFVLAHCDVQGQVSTDAKLLTQNGNASLAVRALSLSNKPVANVEGEVAFILNDAAGKVRPLRKEAFQTDATGVWRTTWPTEDIGTLTAQVSLRDDKKREWRTEKTLWVVGDTGHMVTRVPTLAVASLDDALQPGEHGKIVALFPEGWGAHGTSSGSVWVSLVGQTVYSTELLPMDGYTLVYDFPVERRFGSAVYVQVAYPTASGKWEERTVPVRVIPSQRLLNVTVQADKSEVLPLGEQALHVSVRDNDGNGVVAQLSLSVVDKAVYALQPEFRPNVVDFFYPIGRNNVSSFFSSEFQGYGHGEYLARLLRGTLPYEFAAIKPPSHPAKDKDRDTAFWRADVVTDRRGFADVTFTMPSNQTFWTATAVAADAQGRFGESTAEFASRGEVSLMAALPPFLRAGDKATGSLRIARTNEKGVVENYAVQGFTAGALLDGNVKQTVQLAAGAEQSLALALDANNAGTGLIDLGLSSAHEQLTARRRLAVQPATTRTVATASVTGAGDLHLEVPAGGTVLNASLLLLPGTIATALDSVHELLNEPFGDLQYLVATTMPNLALYQVLDVAGARNKLDPDSQGLLEEARSRAVQGVQRIMALATPQGGFTWFSGYNTPTLGNTLMALEGLGFAADAKLVDVHDTRLQAAARYVSSAGLPFALDAARAYVLARLYGAEEAPRVRALVDRVAGGDAYGIAMTVLAAQQSGVDKEENARPKVEKLVAQSREALNQVAAYSIDRDVFWAYPLQRMGLAALISHAALGTSQDEARIRDARQRFVAALGTPSLSPFERSALLLHNMWLLERDAKAITTAPPPQVTTDNGFLTLEKRGAGFGADLSTPSTPVHINAFNGVALLRAVVETPVMQVQPQSHGMQLDRRYYRIDEGKRTTLTPGEAVPVGADVFVEFTVNAHDTDSGWLRSAYYSVVDAVPAGFVAVEEDQSFRGDPYNLPLTHPALKRRRFDKGEVQLDFEEPAWWQDTPRVVGYMLRAQFPGSFVVPPATMRDRFAPTVGARTGATRVSVADKS